MEKGGRERGSNCKREWYEDWTSGPRDLNGLEESPIILGLLLGAKCWGVLLLWERKVTHGFGVFLRKSFWWGGFLGLLTDKEGCSQQ